MKARLERILYGSKQTVGKWYCLNDSDFIKASFNTIELAWNNNETYISCIPEGSYWVEKRYTKQRGWHLHIKDVENRIWILVHVGNYYTQIEGCILPGMNLKHINSDDLIDVDQSQKALDKILDIMPDEFELEILSV